MVEHKRLPHFSELDGIRGLAALAVFVHHFFNDYTNPHAFVSQLAELGYLGVQVFFVLSGFLITSLLFVDRRKPSMIPDFYWKRVLRIWPALLIYLCAAYIFTAASKRYVLLSLLFVSNFTCFFHPFELGSTWTLAIEEQFYLIWPQVIRFCRVNTVFWLSLVIYILSVALRTLLPILRHDTISMPYTPYQCDGLALGALLACQWFAADRLGPGAAKVSRFLNGYTAMLLWVLLAVLEFRLRESAGHANLNVSLQMTLATFLTYRILVMIVMRESPWLRWLRSKPLTFLGAISYSLYLYHGIILQRMTEALGKVDAQHAVERFALGLAASLAASYASLKLVELPVRRLRKHVLNVRAVPAEAPPI